MAAALFTTLLLFGARSASAAASIVARGPAWHGQFDAQSTNSLKLNLPGGTHAGDVLVASLALAGASSGSQPVITAPTGWTLAGRTNYGTAGLLAIYTHTLAAGESNWTWRTDVRVGGVAFIAAFGGVDTANPIDFSVGRSMTSTSLVATPSGITATNGEAVIASFDGYRSGGGPHWSTVSGMTELGDAAKGPFGASLDDAIQASAGATGPKSSTASQVPDYAIAALTALRPAGSASGPVISGVGTSQVGPSDATVSWSTDQPSDSQVDYGPTASYGFSTVLDPTLVTSHSQSLGGLQASTTYHYRVKSRNSSGALTTSGDGTFTTSAGSGGPVPLIVDTDIYSSADDVGALATAFALQLKQETKLIAIGVNTRLDRPAVTTASWRCVAAIAQFYGFGSVPIGSDMPDNGTTTNTADFVGPCSRLALPSTPAPDTALNVYRRALAAQPDGSVVMVEIGYNENLSNLLHSGPDAISPLNGHDLIAQKVKELVVMGGGYPSRSIENNLAGNPGAAQDVAANWPTKIVWSGYEVGDQIHTGQTISGTHPANSPVRVAYEAFVGPNNWIYSYDLTAVYHAIRPADTTMTEVGPGTNAIDSSGGNVFTMGAGDQYYLKLGSATALDASIEQLLDVVPTQTTTTTSTSTTSTTSTSTTTTSTTATSTTTSSTTTSTTTAPPGPSDNFDSNSLNPAVWSTSSTGSTVAAANQELEITHPGGAWTTGTLTSNPFDITSHAVQVQVKRPAGGDVSTACGSGMTCYGETSVFLWLDSSHYAELFFAGNALTAWINNGAGEVNLTPSWPHYDPTAMQWVRLRESGGMLLFEYAGGTTSPGPWTTLASTNDPFPLTSVRFMLKAGANLDSTDTAQFDNVSTS